MAVGPERDHPLPVAAPPRRTQLHGRGHGEPTCGAGLACRKKNGGLSTLAGRTHNSQYLRYHEYLADGLPIATGVIEGACRHLIADRMDITGARWGLAGSEAILRLRSLRSSGDFDEYWTFHEEQEFIRNHASRYADQQPPTLVEPSNYGHLRVVK